MPYGRNYETEDVHILYNQPTVNVNIFGLRPTSEAMVTREDEGQMTPILQELLGLRKVRTRPYSVLLKSLNTFFYNK